ncbi:hypothetical protein Cha6605_4928 [Chamaesiphon minutus PCC 6605]|uniref:DUF4189 domain-containing protein n=2 Tax=Chamaesiphon TaxID=217161 RepID=K9UL78_CHAP6|nr:hypothetical protein Cha6605_4928 [Chamaesiphon minutus PCC 6605]
MIGMNWMVEKIVLLSSVMAASWLVAKSAQAQIIGCPEGYYGIGGGNAGWIGCAPYDTRSEYPTAPDRKPEPERPRVPTMYANSYIAVAWHPKATDVWATWNQRTAEKSQQVALAACTQIMGAGCTIAVSGYNGSVAIARDKSNLVWYGWGNKPDNAREIVLKDCKDKNKDCKIVHVFTAEPLLQPANFTPTQQKFLETNPAFDFSKNYFPGNPVVSKAPPQPVGNYEIAVNGHQVTMNQQLANISIASALERKQSLERQFANDPRYALMKAGYWELTPRAAGLATGDGCSATFATLNGAVAVAGPNGQYRNAAITFFGGNIPVPKNGQMKKVTLAQTGGKPPATVEAYHFPMANGKLGAVTFVVPDASALVNNMFDEHRFAVSLGTKQALDITWRGGHSIRDRLTKCLKGTGNPY